MAEICPYCHAPIPPSAVTCPYCLKPIERCFRCHSPLPSTGMVNCPKCGAFLLQEPNLAIKIWLEGGVFIDEYGSILVHIANTGNIPTDVSIHISSDEGIDPHTFDDSVENVYPGLGVDKTYRFKITAIKKIAFSDIAIAYTKSSGEKETIKMQPIVFESMGKPVAGIELSSTEYELTLGELNKIFFKVINKGTEKIGRMEIFTNVSPSIKVDQSSSIVTDIEVNETRTGIIKLFPYFTGRYLCEISASYTGPVEKTQDRPTYQHPKINLLFIVKEKDTLKVEDKKRRKSQGVSDGKS